MIHQSFSNWQQSPQQGAIVPRQPDPGVVEVVDGVLVNNVLTDADEIYLTETLTECRVRLESALATVERYSSQLPALATAVADGVTACQSALQVLDEPLAYTVEE